MEFFGGCLGRAGQTDGVFLTTLKVTRKSTVFDRNGDQVASVGDRS